MKFYNKKSIKKPHKNSKSKISVPTWNDEFALPVRSCSVSDIQDYFEYIKDRYSFN